MKKEVPEYKDIVRSASKGMERFIRDMEDVVRFYKSEAERLRRENEELKARLGE